MRQILKGLIFLYQALGRPLVGPCCRFEPSCSEYAKQAVDSRGALAGTYLAVRRILKCHPFHQGGFDPVPAAAPKK